MSNTMYLNINYNILSIKELTLSARVLLAEIISLSKNDGFCYASNAYLSDKLGISLRAVCSSLKELRELHLISTTRKVNARYLHPVVSRLGERDIRTFENADSARPKRNIRAYANAKSAHNNKEDNKKDNINNNRKKEFFMQDEASYDINELMKIK